MRLHYAKVSTPIGSLLLIADSEALREIRFEKSARGMSPETDCQEGGKIVETAARQLADYFAGKRRDFDLPLAPRGTEFQQRVWQELQRIPYGQTLSYGEIARRIGRPTAVRAVGAANGKNPIPIVIPCHRVIGRDGSLTGFGGGIDIKKQLLTLEEADTNPTLPSL